MIKIWINKKSLENLPYLKGNDAISTFIYKQEIYSDMQGFIDVSTYNDVQVENEYLKRMLADERSGDCDKDKTIRRLESNLKALEQELAKAIKTLEFYGDPETYIETHNDLYIKIEPKNDEEVIRSYKHKKKIGWVGTVRVGGKLARQTLAEISDRE